MLLSVRSRPVSVVHNQLQSTNLTHRRIQQTCRGRVVDHVPSSRSRALPDFFPTILAVFTDSLEPGERAKGGKGEKGERGKGGKKISVLRL